MKDILKPLQHLIKFYKQKVQIVEANSIPIWICFDANLYG